MEPVTHSGDVERVAAAQRADAAAEADLAAAIGAVPHGKTEARRLLDSAKNRAAAARDLRQAKRAAHPRPCEPELPCDFHVSYQAR
jgi:hypothetical protein